MRWSKNHDMTLLMIFMVFVIMSLEIQDIESRSIKKQKISSGSACDTAPWGFTLLWDASLNT